MAETLVKILVLFISLTVQPKGIPLHLGNKEVKAGRLVRRKRKSGKVQKEMKANERETKREISRKMRAKLKKKIYREITLERST